MVCGQYGYIFLMYNGSSSSVTERAVWEFSTFSKSVLTNVYSNGVLRVRTFQRSRLIVLIYLNVK
jgi:hypothetical protein